MQGISNDHVYLNVSLNNKDKTFQVAEFDQERNSAFLKNPSEYNVAVARMDFPVNSLELFTFNTTDWFVTLHHGGVDYTVQVTRAPVFGAYSVFDVDSFMGNINDAFAIAFTNLTTANPGVVARQPFMAFNPITQLFTLYYQADYISSATDIIFASTLYLMFESFTVTVNAPSGPIGIKFILKDFFTNSEVVGGQTYLFNRQFAAGSASICDWDSIVVTSNLLPVSPEYTAITTNNGIDTSLNIVFDAKLDSNSTLAPYGTNVVFLPQFYRYLSLNGSVALSKWHLKVWIRRQDGTLSPMFLRKGGHFSIKLVFVKKGLAQ